jgi:hypothetical protein
MIESFKLNLIFDISQTQSELKRFEHSEWTPHFNTGYYSGNWNGLSLRSVGGKLGTLYPDPHSHADYVDTPLLSEFPSVSAILHQFHCPILSVRFLRLESGAVIREHSDNALSYEDGEVRLHIPIATNPGVEFMSNGKKLDLHEGECWYINAGLPHSVVNKGSSDRIHLVFDCMVNDWLAAHFPKPDASQSKNKSLTSIKTQKDFDNMIVALKSLGTPVALEMAEKFLRDGFTEN